MIMEKSTYQSSYNLPKPLEYKDGLVFVLCLSLTIKIILALFTKVISADGVLYITAAQQYAAGGFRAGLAIYPMPAYSLLILLVHFLIRDWIIAALTVNIVMSVSILIPLYLLTKNLFDQRAAFWACLAFAISPLPNHWSVLVLRGPSFMFFFAWAAYFGHRAIQTGKLYFFSLAALFAIFSAAFRVEGFILFPCLILFLIGLIMRKADDRIARIKGICILVVFPLVIAATLFLVLGSSWVSYNRLGELIHRTQSLLSLRFLEQFKLIYEQLESLKAGSYTHSFAQIARRYMLAIYLIGLLEVFVKVLFPAYLIPLVLGFKHSRLRNRGFILFLSGFYLLFIYLYLISVNNVHGRFLFVPTFLLYPWVGVGMDRLCAFLKRSPRPLVLGTILLLIFVCAPVYRAVRVLWKQDDVVKIAGKWLAEVPEFKGKKIITTDARVPFYADRRTGYIRYGDGSTPLQGIEEAALANNADLVVIKKSIKRKDSIPELQHFKRVKEFVGSKRIVVIYSSRDLQSGDSTRSNE
jgi:4-amino-4-deoxy-L-arabinose transferase-like glycosyltransferase